MFVLALAIAAGTAMAQNSIVSNVAGTYVDISGLAGATNLVAADTNDGSFTFTSSVANSVLISNTVYVSSNGVAQ